jgi:hypothetical protein
LNGSFQNGRRKIIFDVKQSAPNSNFRLLQNHTATDARKFGSNNGGNVFTIKDRIGLQKMGVGTGPLPETGTTAIMREFAIPMTWENWLNFECAGAPIEPDGEMEAIIDAAKPREDDNED